MTKIVGLVFRHHNQALAHEAAKFMYEKVKARQLKKDVHFHLWFHP